MESYIPYVRMTTCQFDKVKSVLSHVNPLIGKWAGYDRAKKSRKFRAALFNGESNPRGVIPNNKIAEFLAERASMLSARNKRFAELEYRTVEEAVLQNYVGMVNKLAHKAIRTFPNNHGLTLEDLTQEGYTHVIEAMYKWDTERATLNTIVFVAVRRRIFRTINQNLASISKDDLKLLLSYEDQQRLHSNKSFEEIVELMGLNQDQMILLDRILQRSRLIYNSDSENDYIASNRLVEAKSQNFTEIISQQESVNLILEKANLNSAERELIEIAISNPKHGWQTEFAKSRTNPLTCKPYSRMRITQILKQARSKIAEVISNEKHMAR